MTPASKVPALRAILPLLLAASALGCGPTPPSVTRSSPSVSPPVATSLGPRATISTASVPPQASSSATSPWGPLAVVPPQAGADQARTEGLLNISEHCVLLDTGGGPELLLWSADRTVWNPETKTITFTNFDGTKFSANDGTAVVLGGSGDSNEESGVSTAVWLARTLWVAPPDLSCPLETRWWVGAISEGLKSPSSVPSQLGRNGQETPGGPSGEISGEQDVPCANGEECG